MGLPSAGFIVRQSGRFGIYNTYHFSSHHEGHEEHEGGTKKGKKMGK
jgi:hypothetical protein